MMLSILSQPRLACQLEHSGSQSGASRPASLPLEEASNKMTSGTSNTFTTFLLSNFAFTTRSSSNKTYFLDERKIHLHALSFEFNNSIVFQSKQDHYNQ